MLSAEMAADQEVRDAAECYRQGNRSAAERRCREVLGLHPQHQGANLLLGMLLLGDGRYAEAEVIFGELAATDPDQPSHWINLGTARRGAKKPDAALRAFANAAARGEPTADFYYNVGLTHIDRLDFESARAVLERAVALAPQDAEIRYRYALSCFELRRTAETWQALADWASLADLTPELAANIGTLLMNLGRSAEAEKTFAFATRDPAVDPYVVLTIIEAWERTNRLGEARHRLDQLKTDPRAAGLGADLLLVEAQILEREGRYEAACELRGRVLLEIKEPHLRHFQLFRLARCLDAACRHAAAFEALREAHQSQAAYFALAAPAVTLRGIPAMTITRYDCDPVDVATWDHSDSPSSDQSPIFIVAFPRSGTTLLELTLDSHPMLKSMDEQPFLQSALERLGMTGIQYPEQLGRLRNEDLKRVRDAYWQSVALKVTVGPGQRLVDKNPLNILRVPVIRRLFPNARILLAVRHPCDVLLSCYMQHFRSPDFALLCTSLETLATGYRRTMDFWYRNIAMLQPAIREIQYESFVNDIEFQTREICEFLGLPWDERMLAPATHARGKGFISTPSYSQVVQPINQKAVGRWRAYASEFAPIMPIIDPYLSRWHYAA